MMSQGDTNNEYTPCATESKVRGGKKEKKNEQTNNTHTHKIKLLAQRI